MKSQSHWSGSCCSKKLLFPSLLLASWLLLQNGVVFKSKMIPNSPFCNKRPLCHTRVHINWLELFIFISISASSPGINILRQLLLCNCTWCCSLIQGGFGGWRPVVTWYAAPGCEVISCHLLCLSSQLLVGKNERMEITGSFGNFGKYVVPPCT